MEEENIYNLVAHQAPVMQKPAMYRSKHPGTVDANRRPAATMGPAKQPRPQPNNFLKKREKEPQLPEPTKFEYSSKTKANVPRAEDKPIMGLVSKKNFVTSNAVETMLAVPKKSAQNDNLYVHKKDFGQVPKYLDRVKQEIQDEYQYIQEMENPSQPESLQMMPEEDRMRLVYGLKENWERINKEYQTLSFTLDTPAKRMRKETYEAQLSQIEKDIERLSKKYIFVERQPGF